MKRLILSLTVLFAFALTSQAQFGPEFEYEPGLPNQCTPDLYFGYIGNLPANANPGDVISFEVTIKLQGECATGASNLLVQFQEGAQYVYVNVPVPAFNWDDNSHTVVVNYTVPQQSSGISIYVTSMTIDSNLQVSESNENNNTVLSTPILPTVIL
jgi:hypothetical protein